MQRAVSQEIQQAAGEKKKKTCLLSLFERLAIMCRMAHDNVKRHNTSNNSKSTPDYKSKLMKCESAIP